MAQHMPISQVNKQTNPWNVHIKILTDFYVGDSHCICEPQRADWYAIEKTPELKRRRVQVQHRAMMVIVANLAKQCFSSSLTSTSSLTASSTDSLGEAGTTPGVDKPSPMQQHCSLCTKSVPVGMDLVGRVTGTPPLSKGIPDSISDLVTQGIHSNSSSELVGNVNGYSINGMVKDSIGHDIEQKTYSTDGLVGN